MLLFGVLAILAGLATLILPKSEGGGLPDTLEDMKKKSRYLHVRIMCGSRGGTLGPDSPEKSQKI